MQPSTTPIRPVEQTTCTDCDQPLEPGQRWRCKLCVRAAEIAVQEVSDRPIEATG